MRVIPVPGEPTRYRVESNSLECTKRECGKLYTRRNRHLLAPGDRSTSAYLFVGDPCPKCGSRLDLRFHLVDIASFNRNGQCDCEYFSCGLGPKVAALLPEHQAEGRHRCAHIAAARDFALDLSLTAHQRRNGGEREAVGP